MSFFKSIKWSPCEYVDAAVIAHECAEGILNRLEWMTLEPKLIADVGCGTGKLGQLLQKKYPDAQVVGIDNSQAMLDAAAQAGIQLQLANAENLPFANGTVDIIIANLLTPWHDDLSLLLKEWRRVLCEDGLLMFTAFGPDTLKEWRGILQSEDIPFFIDMHDLGDLLLQSGFAEPVLDVEHFTLSYREKQQMVRELIATGMWFAEDISPMAGNFQTDEPTDITYEVVFAHAFAPKKTTEASVSDDGVVRIPLDSIRKRLRGESY